MENIQHYYVNISAPNLVVICIDESGGEERAGRMYHCYSGEPRKFSSIVELIRIMEEFFDDIAYPQASTMTRRFRNAEGKEHVRYSKVLPEKVLEQKEIIEHRGKVGTFITYVQFRQNSDWQGQMSWPEKKRAYKFCSTLEFIKILSEI